MAQLIIAERDPYLLQKKITTFGADSFQDASIPCAKTGTAFSILKEDSFFLMPANLKIKINGVQISKKYSLSHCDRLEWDGGVAIFVDSVLPANLDTESKSAINSLQILQDLAFRLQREGEGAVHSAFDSIVESAGADEGYLLSELNKELEWHLVASKTSDPSKTRKSFLSNTILRDALEKRAPIYVESIIGHPYAEAASVIAAKVFSVACFPLIVKEEIIGAVFLYTRTPGKTIQKSRLGELNLLVTQVALLLSLASKRKNGVANSELVFATTSPMLEVQEKIRKLAPTPLPILVLGETGVGKELVARSLHQNSDRKNGPLISVNCAAIPESLLESTLFGHEKGAFTGAVKSQTGKFELANGGTLFLDEIGDLPLELQAKLLRVLQEKAVEPLGSNRLVKVDVRVITATHQNLEKKIQDKSFRQDLFYRLNGAKIVIPALRTRSMDIPLLAELFLKRNCAKTFSADCLEAIIKYPWPGNVRELEQVVSRSAYLAEGSLIETKDLDLDLSPSFLENKEEFWETNLSSAQASFTKNLVERTLQKNQGSRPKTAAQLGISERTLYRILSENSGSSANLD